MSEYESRSASASDVGLIVQGVLILLSSLVAIGGYIVQGKMRSKERAREIVDKQRELSNQKKIERIQETIFDPRFAKEFTMAEDILARIRYRVRNTLVSATYPPPI